MGLLNEADWQGQWIGLDRPAPGDSETQWSRLAARYLRKEFALTKEVKRATVHIAGMGLYELFINGQRIGEQVLAPAPTDYRKTILYNTYDVTPNSKRKCHRCHPRQRALLHHAPELQTLQDTYFRLSQTTSESDC